MKRKHPQDYLTGFERRQLAELNDGIKVLRKLLKARRRLMDKGYKRRYKEERKDTCRLQCPPEPTSALSNAA